MFAAGSIDAVRILVTSLAELGNQGIPGRFAPFFMGAGPGGQAVSVFTF